MPSVQKTKVSKLRRHVLKKLTTTLHGLRLSGLIGRIKGPRILLNSIPKAGTHLLERSLEQFPLLRNAGRETLMAPNFLDKRTLKEVLGIPKGQFLNAHLRAHQELLRALRDTDIKVLFMVRDPRDVAISTFKYLTNIDCTHRAHSFFTSLKNDDERLTACLNGVEGIVVSIIEVFKRFAPWLAEDYVFLCKFEDLIGEKGGGNKTKQLNLLKGISQFLDIDLNEKEIEMIADKVYFSGSSTFNKGVIGAWRQVFKEEHNRLFMQEGKEVLNMYGYEAE